jgi:hypothetical protein
MISRVRRGLLTAAKELAEHRRVPPGVDHPEAYRQRSGGVILDADADWIEATTHLRQAYVTHPELDLSIAGGRI